VVDGAIVPWDVVPPLKLHELVKYHSETAPDQPALMYTSMILVMNPDSYARLPADLQKIIDDNSGLELSRFAGHLYDTQVVATGHKLAAAQGNQIITLSEDETLKWKQVGQSLYQDWIDEVEEKGYANGAALLEEARQLIAKYSAPRAQ
jgi:TRAP-type C4-dicarboxylate transport system substrate-binding protein